MVADFFVYAFGRFWLRGLLLSSSSATKNIVFPVFFVFSQSPPALEKPSETALLMSLCGVGCVVLHQWPSSLEERAQSVDNVLDRRFTLCNTGMELCGLYIYLWGLELHVPQVFWGSNRPVARLSTPWGGAVLHMHHITRLHMVPYISLLANSCNVFLMFWCMYPHILTRTLSFSVWRWQLSAGHSSLLIFTLISVFHRWSTKYWFSGGWGSL